MCEKNECLQNGGKRTQVYFSDKFICADRKCFKHDEPVAVPLFSREFEYDGAGAAALTLTGLGFYRLFVNGTELENGRLVLRSIDYSDDGKCRRDDTYICVGE